MDCDCFQTPFGMAIRCAIATFGSARSSRSKASASGRLISMVSGIAVAATHRYPDQTVDVAFNPVGQVVGQFEKVEKTSAVIERWVNEYLEATERLDRLNAAAGV